jgi:hypothetical protein
LSQYRLAAAKRWYFLMSNSALLRFFVSILENRSPLYHQRTKRYQRGFFADRCLRDVESFLNREDKKKTVHVCFADGRGEPCLLEASEEQSGFLSMRKLEDAGVQYHDWMGKFYAGGHCPIPINGEKSGCRASTYCNFVPQNFPKEINPGHMGQKMIEGSV